MTMFEFLTRTAGAKVIARRIAPSGRVGGVKPYARRAGGCSRRIYLSKCRCGGLGRAGGLLLGLHLRHHGLLLLRRHRPHKPQFLRYFLP